MINFGAVPSGAVLPVLFDSFDGGTGASLTLTGLAITDVEIYKGTSMTQRASDAGVVLLDTDGIDLDGVTGIHGFSIDTGDNTDAGFYAVGSFFTVIVASVTIDAQTVNFVAATFRIVAAEALAGKPKADVDAWLGTAAATPTVAGVPEVDLTHLGGVAQSATDLKDFADDGYDPSTNKVQGVVLTDTVTTYTGNTPQTGDSFARIGATGAGLTTLASQASVDDLPTNAELATALGTADDAILAAIAALNNLSQANIRTAVGLGSANLDTQLGDLPTTAELATALGTADDAILAAIAALNNLSQAGIRTAVGLGSANLDTQLSALDDLLDTEVAAIKAKTDSLTFTAAGMVDANVQRINDVTITGDGSATPFGV